MVTLIYRDPDNNLAVINVDEQGQVSITSEALEQLLIAAGFAKLATTASGVF